MMDWHVERRSARIGEVLISEAELERGLLAARQARADTFHRAFTKIGRGLAALLDLPRPSRPSGSRCAAC